ncbi:MAG: GatB/YqeY domain-containing protein [Anaerolineae bacterium]|jgi:uncharacterized protein YqeY
MSTKERLMEDLKTAMREHDVVRRDAIRMARAAIGNAEIALQREVTDEEAIKIIAKEVNLRKDAVEMFRRGGRDDLVANELAGIAVLVAYLPELMSEDDIRTQAAAIIQELGASSMQDLGPVMRTLMSNLSGRAEGRVVNRIVREMLGG